MILREHLLYIGIGQCGGNIGDEFQKQNIQTICVNSSLRDLDTLKYVNQKLHLKDGAGANHNRKKSNYEKHAYSLTDNREELERIEHRRWNIFMITHGFKYEKERMLVVRFYQVRLNLIHILTDNRVP